MTIAPPKNDSFTIILPVLNAAAHLVPQLESIARQSDANWHLIASDDGSTDESVPILQNFAALHPDKVEVLTGPKRGLMAHITALLGAVPAGTGPIVLCDQDDIWFDGRLAADRAAMLRLDPTHPALFCRRTQLCNENGDLLGLSPDRPRPPAFANALVQNIASGNTMVLNRVLLERLHHVAAAAQDCAYHDWWIYQIATGTGGQVRFDPEPMMLYRQHAGNLVGVPRGWSGLLRRANRLLSGSRKADGATHLDALHAVRDTLTPEARTTLDTFRATRDGGPFGRLKNVLKLGVYRQSRVETMLVWFAAVGGRT